jgi:hypothetical protein
MMKSSLPFAPLRARCSSGVRAGVISGPVGDVELAMIVKRNAVREVALSLAPARATT